ncbi:MAG: hypothetical protein IPL84_01595 [Chitinophagaceae bacterium]|nr:hypothetical protein [Chitinophagaceae bacterium]
MKQGISYILFLAAVAFLFTGCGSNLKKRPSLVETYAKKDIKPFGADIAFRQVRALYNGNTIRESRLPFYNTWQNINDTGALYICVTPKLFLNTEEVEAMMAYVHAGNSLFISAGAIDDLLLDEIGCGQEYIGPLIESMAGEMKNTAVRAADDTATKYPYYYYPFQNYFTGIDSSNTRILGYNDSRQPNSIVHFYGSGKLYLHCEPRAFSNYFLLTKNNYQYLNKMLAFTQNVPQHVYWDDYYHKLNRRRNSSTEFSTFSEIMKHPALKYAFWLSFLLLGLYILFGGKLLQRVIKELKPNENTTVTFTETIGRLYLQKKDNKNIADKMITYFNEYIRNTYFLSTNHINEEFIMMLSRKSGVSRDAVDTLYRSILATQGSASVNDYQLLSLNEQIQHFYKKTK